MKTTDSVPFLVGRITRDGVRKNVMGMVVLEPATPTTPIPGPWDLRAVFTAA
jgi:hypothetical protein